MPRTARVVVPGVPHHITQRGNNRQQIFHNESDYRKYLSLLAEHTRRDSLRILALCVMPNHVHAIAVPETEASLQSAIGLTHQRYSTYYNLTNRRSGRLWESRFYSCPLYADHLHNALLYVELNPVRAGIAPTAWDYKWSSARTHVFGVPDSYHLLDTAWWAEYAIEMDWKEWLCAPLDASFVDQIRICTRSGKGMAEGTATGSNAAGDSPQM